MKRKSGQMLKYKIPHIKYGKFKGGKMEIKARVDEKGRIIIPAKVRKKMKIEPMMQIEVRIERVHERKSFLEIADDFRRTLKKKEDAVKVLHEESPFR